MKTILLSFILIFGLSATNHGNPLSKASFTQDLTLEEEAYVDDIPFDTHAIACRYLLEKMTTREEGEVNDIPFNTERLFNLCRMEKLTQIFRNEKTEMDFPYDTRRLANISFYTFSHPGVIEIQKISLMPVIEPRNQMNLSSFSL